MEIKVLQCNHIGKFLPVAWAIKFFQKTDYSHYALMIYELEESDPIILDSTHSGVKEHTLEEFFEKYTVRRVISLKDIPGSFTNHELLREWKQVMKEKRYGYLQLLGILLSLRWLGFGEKAITCNELVLRFLNLFYRANIKNIDILGLKETEKEVRRFEK